MPELAAHLRSLRAELVETMVAELAADGDWHGWLGLLATVETAIQAVEAVIEERADCARGVPHAAQSAPGACTSA